MPSFDELYSHLPLETQAFLKSIWGNLPEKERGQLQNILKGIPVEPNLTKLLLDLAVVQLKLAFGKKRSVAIIGPANVGKSTLYNQLVRSRHDRAVVSPLPGTTRVNQEADAGLFTIIDTPGADAVGEVGEIEKQHALTAAEGADFLVIIFDAIQGIKRTEQDLFKELVAINKPYLVVLNKSDLVRRELTKVVELSAKNLNMLPEQVIPIAARDGKNIDQVLISIATIDPEIVAALGSALPQFRWQFSWRAIISAASLSAVIALAPLPFIDFLPLVFTQSIMVLTIARIYNYQINLERARELVTAFGIGFLGRTLFQELSKLGGVPGWLLAASIASSTTVAMGYAATIWFEKNERVSRQSLKQITSEMTRYLLSILRKSGKSRPAQTTLRQEISEALAESPYSQDRSSLEKDSEHHT
jgi:small GTP-binding protein